jgi:KipI family sensor histidine kinase inhibitor
MRVEMIVAGSASATIAEYGDSGLLVSFTHEDPAERWAAGQALQAALSDRRAEGIVDVVASFESVFVTFDLLRTDHDAVRALIAAASGRIRGPVAGRDFTVPVVYGGEYGPDLEVVATELGLGPDEVVALHTSAPWTIRLRASPAAAPMMDGPTLPGRVSRNATPRTTLAPGSVGLSGRQCMIYPVASPGGWRLIGRTPVPLLDLARPELVAYRPGDRLHFRVIDARSWDAWTSVALAPDAG